MEVIIHWKALSNKKQNTSSLQNELNSIKYLNKNWFRLISSSKKIDIRHKNIF